MRAAAAVMVRHEGTAYRLGRAVQRPVSRVVLIWQWAQVQHLDDLLVRRSGPSAFCHSQQCKGRDGGG
jgi:hypothetical protein